MKEATEDETVGWHHQLSGREFEQTPGHSEGQGSLACCSPGGCKELDRSDQLNNKNVSVTKFTILKHFKCTIQGN